jgi:hypothetical protein
MGLAGHVELVGKMRNVISLLVGEYIGNRQFERHKND